MGNEMKLFDGEFVYLSPTHSVASVCHVCVEQVGEGDYLVTATELGTNPGPSVTHSWIGLAEAVCERVLPDVEPEKIRWKERYDENSYQPKLKSEPSPDAEVFLPVLSGGRTRFGEPRWRIWK